jgi:hypothetical protein
MGYEGVSVKRGSTVCRLYIHQTEYSSNSHGTFCLISPSPNHILLSRQFAYTRTYETCEYVPPGMAVNEVVLVGFEFRDLMISCAGLGSRSSSSDE